MNTTVNVEEDKPNELLDVPIEERSVTVVSGGDSMRFSESVWRRRFDREFMASESRRARREEKAEMLGIAGAFVIGLLWILFWLFTR